MSSNQTVIASPGAKFVRADLHVHSHSDSDDSPNPDFAPYIATALEREISVLGITDHNSTTFVRQAMAAAEGTGITLVPGIEISTRDGHLLALFGADAVNELESFATVENLRLVDLSEGGKRSDRSIIDLVTEIGNRGGLAIPAHVDASNGICGRMNSGALRDLLCNPALGGLEFSRSDALQEWFSDKDEEVSRAEAWKARQRDPELRERGLAKLMSSDAHSPEKVGQDKASRTMTRLRIDDANFAALRNAIQLNPKARCKAEVTLPAEYPRILRAEFEGGFLDGVAMDFTGNLNCLIGGRGSGKSTALLSIRSALGAAVADSENPDDPDRMPEKTTVTFLDNAGSERVATRNRGGTPVADDGSPVRLRLADLGQDESGRLARGYTDEPKVVLDFLDVFINRHQLDEEDEELLSQLEENGAEVVRTSVVPDKIKKLEADKSRLEGEIEAAKKGRIEEVAQYAAMLSSQKPLLEELERQLQAPVGTNASNKLDLGQLASQFGVDLDQGPAKEFVPGDDGLEVLLEKYESERSAITSKAVADIGTAGSQLRVKLAAWSSKQRELEGRLEKKRAELKEQGLEIQANALVEKTKRLGAVNKQLVELQAKKKQHSEARDARRELLDKLRLGRDRLFESRKTRLKEIAAAANEHSGDLEIRVGFDREGINGIWQRWLTENFSLRTPRVGRVAKLISPAKFADLLITDQAKLATIQDEGATQPPFGAEEIARAFNWETIFKLETLRLEDRPRIQVQRKGSPDSQPFDHLSAGQQRSVLLSLLLCADRSEPLVLDQPEDHLDGQYIASAVVRHLEAAKEKRQVLIATHSPNLVVLGDSELVVPMRVVDGHGKPYAVGAVDRPETRDQVCLLLEGGAEAYKKRGTRYGFIFRSDPPSASNS